MAIKDIQSLNLYVRTSGGTLEGRMIDTVPYPMLVLMDGLEILAAMKFSVDNDAWRVKNVAAINKYGPTIYKILMEIADKNGISTAAVKGNSSECFVVPQCKEIWNQFNLNRDVTASFLDNGHQEEYLNKKYVCDNIRWDSEVAMKNFEKYIDELAMQQISNNQNDRPRFIDRLKSILGIKPSMKLTNSAKEIKQYEQKKRAEEIEIALWRDVDFFLKKSVKPHR